jgi:hypothetical protein
MGGLSSLFVVIIVRSRPVISVITSLPVVPVVPSLSVVPLKMPLSVVAILTSGRVVALCENRATLSTELLGISPQACHDPIHIGDLGAAQPPDIGSAGHLLFPRSPIFLRKRGVLKGDAAAHRYREAQQNSKPSHVHPFWIGTRD